MKSAQRNDNRLRKREIVELAPGIHLRGLERIAGVSFTTVRHHVRKLEEFGEIERVRLGKYERIFPPGYTAGEKKVDSAMRSKSTKRILDEIFARGLTTNGEVSRATGLAKSTVSKHAGILSNLGLVKREKDPYGKTKYGIAETPLGTLLHLAHSGLKNTVDRYVDLWDF